MLRLGEIYGFSYEEVSSVKKGETIADTIRTVSSYCDVIAMRHSKDGQQLLHRNSRKNLLLMQVAEVENTNPSFT
jgi:aspartate carbamoyltransferase catalytic subunit